MDLAILLSETQPPTIEAPPPVEPPTICLSQNSSISEFAKVYPLWYWFPDANHYTWKTRFFIAKYRKLPASLSTENWEIIQRFFLRCSWLLDQHGKTSYLELAYLFNHYGFLLHGVPQTPAKVSTLIKKALNFAAHVQTDRGLALAPGTPQVGCKANGKVHCCGFLAGALVHLPTTVLKDLALAFVGRSHTLASWDFPF